MAYMTVCHLCNFLIVEDGRDKFEKALHNHSVKSHDGEWRFLPETRIPWRARVNPKTGKKPMDYVTLRRAMLSNKFWDDFNNPRSSF